MQLSMVWSTSGVEFASTSGMGQIDASLWIRNLADKTYFLTASAVTNGAYTGSVGTPRLGALLDMISHRMKV